MKELIQSVLNSGQAQFASLTYTTKKTGETARYTVQLGTSYHSLVEKSLLELQLLVKEQKSKWNDLQRIAAARVIKSLRKTLAAHKVGQQNADYTKKDQYVPLGQGLNLNTSDNTLQLFGVLRSKVTITVGTYKPVKSAPLTIEQNKIRKLLPLSQFREFALDLGNIQSARLNGETIEIE